MVCNISKYFKSTTKVKKTIHYNAFISFDNIHNQLTNWIAQKPCQYEYHKDGHLACVSIPQTEPSWIGIKSLVACLSLSQRCIFQYNSYMISAPSYIGWTLPQAWGLIFFLVGPSFTSALLTNKLVSFKSMLLLAFFTAELTNFRIRSHARQGMSSSIISVSSQECPRIWSITLRTLFVDIGMYQPVA